MESIWSHKPLIQVLVFEYLPELTHCDRALSTLAAGFVMFHSYFLVGESATLLNFTDVLPLYMVGYSHLLTRRESHSIFSI